MKLFTMDEDGTVHECNDVKKWAEWFETAKRTVRFNDFGEVRVSTIFLGMDHSFGFDLRPILFETMIFGGIHDTEQWRYSTREEAIAGHKNALKKVLQ